jgi:hypothetical protein
MFNVGEMGVWITSLVMSSVHCVRACVRACVRVCVQPISSPSAGTLAHREQPMPSPYEKGKKSAKKILICHPTPLKKCHFPFMGRLRDIYI